MRQAELEACWYGDRRPPWHWIVLSRIYAALAGLRRKLYRAGLRPIGSAGCPVIVVGNITSGGTGKTPLVIWIAEVLRSFGWRVGIVSRGYGGRKGTRDVIIVRSDSDFRETGDEPVLIARRTGLPVAIHGNRYLAARYLRDRLGVNVVVSDDGLQHYALAREVEICVVDGERRFGNGRLLPAGPLREPVSRLRNVDFVVTNGDAGEGEIEMRLRGGKAVSLATGESRPLGDLVPGRVHAVAGIGNPDRFFHLLEDAGLDVVRHPLPDHHAFGPGELAFGDGLPVVMTEKDAVRLGRDGPPNAWCVPVEAELADGFRDRLLRALVESSRKSSTDD